MTKNTVAPEFDPELPRGASVGLNPTTGANRALTGRQAWHE